MQVTVKHIYESKTWTAELCEILTPDPDENIGRIIGAILEKLVKNNAMSMDDAMSAINLYEWEVDKTKD